MFKAFIKSVQSSIRGFLGLAGDKQPSEQDRLSTASREEQRSLYAELVGQLYDNAHLGIFASILNAIVLAVILRDVASRTGLAAWVAVLAAISVWRYRHIRAFLRRSPEPSDADRWCLTFILGLTAAGLVWGSSAVFLFPAGSLEHQVFLAFVVGGMVAGAAAAFSSVMTAFLAYSVAALLPVIIRFALIGDEFHLAMAGMTLLYGVMMVFIAERIRAVRVASVKLRFENAGLLSYSKALERTEKGLRKTRDDLDLIVKERTAELKIQTRRAEAERDRLMTLIESMAEAVWVTDADGRIVLVNAIARSQMAELGFEPNDIKNTREMHVEMSTVDGRPLDVESLEGMSRKAALQGLEIVVRNIKTGEPLYRRISVSPLFDSEGRFEGSVAIVQDITAEKKAEEEKGRLEAQLLQAQKMESIGTLAGGIAHDFNNMLAVILGNAELALDDLKDCDGPSENMEQILKASKRARDLTKQILTFSRRTERGRNRTTLTPLLEETYTMLRGTLPAMVRMQLDIQTKSDTVLADPSQIQQVLINLATNAAYAMKKEGGDLTISLSDVVVRQSGQVLDTDLPPGAYVKLSVRDTGTGMTEPVLRRVFEPFFTTKGPGQGTGMGLAVVYGIVKAHGGDITVESTPGQGSLFNVFLPLSRVDEDARPEETDEVPCGRERILLVDDEQGLLETTSRTLRGLGYSVATAVSGSEAWEMLEKDREAYDLVITDQVMPNLMGAQLAEKIRKARLGLPIILVTGYSENLSREDAKAAGINAFATKPLTKQEFARAIRDAVNAQRQDLTGTGG